MSPQLSDLSNLTVRDMLKIKLIKERSQFTPKGFYPECPICGTPIFGAPDMHEAIITRGQVSGHDFQNVIYSKYNCVLRHQFCPSGKQSHTPGIGSENDYLKCVVQIIQYEGYTDTNLWLLSMNSVFPTITKQAWNRFNSTLMDYRAKLHDALFRLEGL